MSVGGGGCTGVMFVVVDGVVFVVGMGGLRGMVLVVSRLGVVIRVGGCF